ncbi:MAG: PD-(D/E)XK nuclease family protein, partial [Firmicutes bacterium]|nr:PD-(D/E)XK nuclease family protein [Bacillota bacterium]
FRRDFCYYYSMRIFTADTQTACFARVAEEIKKFGTDLDEKHFVIVPDRFTLETEIALMEALGTRGSFGAEVITLNRLLARLRPGGRFIGPSASVMLLSKLADDLRGSMECFVRSAHTRSFPKKMLETIVRLKNCRIPPDALELPGEGALNRKMRDVGRLYAAYEERLARLGLCDFSGKLDLLVCAVEADDTVKKCRFYLCAFDTVNAQVAAVARALDKHSLGVTAAVLYADGVFYQDSQLVKLGCGVHPNAAMSDTSLTPEGGHIRKNLFVRDAKRLHTDNITIHEAVSMRAAVDKACRVILQKVRAGLRFGDIAVAGLLSDTDAGIFREYGIKINFEKKTPLLAHPLAAFVLDCFTCAARGLSAGYALAAVKNPLFVAAQADKDSFENALKRYAVKSVSGGMDYITMSGYGRIRVALLALTGDLSGKLATAATAAEYAGALLEFLDREDIRAAAAALCKDPDSAFAKLSEQAEQKIRKLLNAAAEMLGGARISKDRFAQILSNGFADEHMSIVPSEMDAVTVAPPSSFCMNRYKLMIFCGFNDGVMPARADANAELITDKDADGLAAFGLAVEPVSKQISAAARLELQMAMLLSDGELYLIHYKSDNQGADTKQSPFLTAVEALFDGICYSDDESDFLPLFDDAAFLALDARARAAYINAMFSGAVPARRFAAGAGAAGVLAVSLRAAYQMTDDKSQMTNKIGSGNSEPYLPSVICHLSSDSASALERYFECPYKYFLSYGLGLAERKEGGLRALDAGMILHKVAELFFEKRFVGPDEAAAYGRDAAAALLSGLYIPDGAVSSAAAKKLTAEAGALCASLYEQSSRSLFVNAGAEQWIGAAGKPDRWDVYTAPDETRYAAVIDYKSGAHDFRAAYAAAGISVQLPLYMGALIKAGYRPAAMLYFPVSYDYTAAGARTGRMYGFVCDDAELARALDTGLSNERPISGFFPLTLTKDGVRRTAAARPLNELEHICRYGEDLAARARGEIAEGYIAKSPVKLYGRHGCDFCRAAGLCGFRGAARALKDIGFGYAAEESDYEG